MLGLAEFCPPLCWSRIVSFSLFWISPRCVSLCWVSRGVVLDYFESRIVCVTLLLGLAEFVPADGGPSHGLWTSCSESNSNQHMYIINHVNK